MQNEVGLVDARDPATKINFRVEGNEVLLRNDIGPFFRFVHCIDDNF